MAGITEKTLNAIEAARTKSESARHSIALIIAGAFTVAVALVWVFVLLPFRLDNVAQGEVMESNSPFSALKAQVSGAYDDLMKNIHGQVEKVTGGEATSIQDEYQKMKLQAQTQN